MMIGRLAVAGRARTSRQTSVPSTTGRFRSRIIRSGGGFADRPERGVAARHDLDAGVAAPLERVLDELGDVDFVFDDQDAGQVLAHVHVRPAE